MKKAILFVLTTGFLLGVVSQAFAVGLGSTYYQLEHEWNKGYRQEFPLGDSYKSINLGISRNSYISYTTGDGGNCFGHPERIGRIDGVARALLSQQYGAPSANLFFKKVKSLMPSDSRLVAVYRENNGTYIFEQYYFKSFSLARMKGIKGALPYQSAFGIKGDPPGTFELIVNYAIGSVSKIENFTLTLGMDDHEGLKRIRKNPFR